MGDLSKWPIFSVLDPDFQAKIVKICVYGSSGNEAIFLTTDDDVYAIGSNCSSCLGLGDTHSSFEPRKIDALSKKQVIDIAFGSGPHVLAVTAVGDLFSWGHNGYCQLGNGGSNQGMVPSIISTNLQGRKVAKVACGSHHSLALTTDGEIYAWGQNNCGQVGSGTTSNQPTPRKLTSVIGSRIATDIACGQTCSVALVENKEVYGWGYNGNGQLGLGSNVNQPTPSRVQYLQDVIICQVVCGYAHTLALSDIGELYSWGANSYGQLGTGNKANQVLPVKVTANGERFIEVGASHYSHLSCAMTQTGHVYMWGQCRGQSVTTPFLTRFQNTDDIFAAFSSPPITWRIFNLESVKGSKINQCMAKAFDDPLTSDLKIQVEGKDIHVHKAVLKIRMSGHCSHVVGVVLALQQWQLQGLTDVPSELSCTSLPQQWAVPRGNKIEPVAVPQMTIVNPKPSRKRRPNQTVLCDSRIKDCIAGFLKYCWSYSDRTSHSSEAPCKCEHFRSMFGACWEEADKDVIEISQYSYKVYRAFLRFLYTDLIEARPDEAIGLLDLANAYCEPALKAQCEQIIKQGISVENVAMLYAAAIKFEAKELEEFCFKFAFNHMTAVTQSEAFITLDDCVLKELMRKVASSGGFKF